MRFAFRSLGIQETDEEPDEQELKAHYMYMAKIQEHFEQPESINDTYIVEKVDSNVFPHSSDMCDNEGKADQNADEAENERVLLASLIANLKSMENDDLKARLQEKTNVNAELHNLLNKMKGKSVDTKFEKQLVGRQPNAFKFQKSSVMGKPSLFLNSLERYFFPKSRFAPKTNVKDLSEPVTL
ncbi:hypothetical protein Tco_0278581 [Tanacetum coccineum]